MKCLFDKLTEYDTIIFDMDGCLYDEFDFVSLRFKQIVNNLVVSSYQDNVLNEMLSNWLEFGSADNTLFSKIEKRYLNYTENAFEQRALEIYRTHPVNLKLSNRTSFILSQLKSLQKVMLMVSDGNAKLQKINVYRYTFVYLRSLVWVYRAEGALSSSGRIPIVDFCSVQIRPRLYRAPWGTR